MNEQQAEIYRTIIESCDAILAAIKDKETPAAMAALVICMVVLAHEDSRNKQELIGTISRRIEESWSSFTRAHIKESLRRLRRQKLSQAWRRLDG